MQTLKSVLYWTTKHTEQKEANDPIPEDQKMHLQEQDVPQMLLIGHSPCKLPPQKGGYKAYGQQHQSTSSIFFHLPSMPKLMEQHKGHSKVISVEA